MLTLDEARLLMDPPHKGGTGRTFILSSDLLEFARKRGLKLKIDKPQPVGYFPAFRSDKAESLNDDLQ